MSSLHEAVKTGNIDKIQELLRANSDVNAKDERGRTALIEAARLIHEVDQEAGIRLLLGARADVEAADNDGLTSLILAVVCDHGNWIRLLLEARADVETADNHGTTALITAVILDRQNCIRVLLEARADVEAANNDGATALMCAAAKDHQNCVGLLLEARADVKAADNTGGTPLITAAFNGCEACIRLLLEAGANVEAVNSFGATALISAAVKGHVACGLLLLEARADVAALGDLHSEKVSLLKAAAKVAEPSAGYQAAGAVPNQNDVDSQQVSSGSAKARLTFANSSFKELYDGCKLPEDYGVMDFICDFVNWLRAENLADVAQAVKAKLLEKSQEFSVFQLATFAWTLADEVDGHQLCSYINGIVREDSKERLKPLIPMVRAMNKFIVSRGGAAEQDWPVITYRGPAMPCDQIHFFEGGKQYRCPMFLSTSFQKEVAMDFARMNGKKGKAPVMFHVRYDKQLRCAHVKYLKKVASIESEEEFLFPPYSTFTVTLPPRQDGKIWIIEVAAQHDNKEAPEDLPLAVWH
eukprot:Skav202373  [mRNA]  locus=scaffold1406:160285:161868:+ [translate_table: standard]